MKNSLFPALSSVVVRCETPQTTHDQLFDVHIPKHIYVKGFQGSKQQQDLFATAHRCMNNWCFLKPARAYVLGLFVDHAALNRLKAHADVSRDDIFTADCPKSFVLYFASSKDIKHIKRGFTRSFENFIKNRPELQLNMIQHFLAVLDGQEGLSRGDFIRVSCQPALNTLTVAFNDKTEVVIPNAAGLIDWIHSLYVGLESNPTARYVSMQQKLRLASPLD
jgi:hypothetical protein